MYRRASAGLHGQPVFLARRARPLAYRESLARTARTKPGAVQRRVPQTKKEAPQYGASFLCFKCTRGPYRTDSSSSIMDSYTPAGFIPTCLPASFPLWKSSTVGII